MPRKGNRGAPAPHTPAAPPASTHVVQAVPASAAPPAPAPEQAAKLAQVIEQDVSTMSAADRENPQKLHGAALRDLGYRMGLPRSEMAKWDDAKVREQCKAITYRRFAESAEA